METDNPFEKVLNRLRRVGHRKYGLGPKEGPNCLNGAAMYENVLFDTPFLEITSHIALSEYRERVTEGRLGELAFDTMAGLFFNNHPDTTFEDVERVLEKAAVKWEEERVTR